MSDKVYELSNDAYTIRVRLIGGQVWVWLIDERMGFVLADEPYLYRATVPLAEGALVAIGLKEPAVAMRSGELEIGGELAGLAVRHVLRLPSTDPVMDEFISLSNGTGETIRLIEFTAGFQRRVGSGYGEIDAEVAEDRLAAVPLKHRATDPSDFDADFCLQDLIARPGSERRATDRPKAFAHGHVPSMQWSSEGWAWLHGGHAVVIAAFNQKAMQFSTLALETPMTQVNLRYGGVSMVDGEPSELGRIGPGQRVALGVTRFQTVSGGYSEAAYAYRGFLDAQGCRFPEDFDPPVHWNELYDNAEWNLARPSATPLRRMTRPMTYTRAQMEDEAQKARAYGCQSLYLDPGWDTDFATFLWGEEWLGPRKQFVDEMREAYGLKVSLHCPLATWMSMDGRGVSSWPIEALQMDAEGRVIEGAICLGSRQYLDAAAERLLAHCRDGVVFLMFDGNWWNAGCWNPDHGHPVPYTKEDHALANLELARRIHREYPDVLIEMHDMISGGSVQRYTPVYYKYGMTGSYDANWGFELMWRPMDDLRSGRARSLYFYNLGCNVPLYLHIDLRDDNTHCVVLWWYASTCRYLGIGGTHADPMVVMAHKLAMSKYRRLERFYKRGEFFGMNEQVHVHALVEEQGFVVNLFNLSGEARTVRGRISLEQMGLDLDRWYVQPKGLRIDQTTGDAVVDRLMPAWSAEVVEVTSFRREQ